MGVEIERTKTQSRFGGGFFIPRGEGSQGRNCGRTRSKTAVLCAVTMWWLVIALETAT